MLRTYKFIGATAVALALITAPTASFAGVFIGVGIGVSVNIAPPPIPVYVQPPALVADTIWTPGYWGYGSYGYYWVPGTWVAAPRPGFLWTPGYWGYGGGGYAWHGGYWGPHIGFYGGVNYGFGYVGVGYVGGGWYGDHFRYNTAVTNVNRTTINNVYVNRTVINNYNNTTVNRVSYNGGPNGVQARPTETEAAYQNESHLPPTAIQRDHIQTASQNRNYLANVNHGTPGEAAFATPLSRENRPANFAPATAADRSAGTRSSDAFSRFNAQRGTDATSGSMSNPNRATGANNDGYRPAATDSSTAGRSANTYGGDHTYGGANTYHPPAATNGTYGNAYRPSTNTYRAPADTYRSPGNAYRPATNGYHPTANAYRPANTYHAPTPRVAHNAPHVAQNHPHDRDH